MSTITLKDIQEPIGPHKIATTLYVSHWAVVLGRTLFSAIFILASFNHFLPSTVNYAVSQGVPFASFAVPLSGLMALFGGLSILFGFKERIGAILLMLFLAPVTLMMHNFWAVSDPTMAGIQQAMFFKNVALFGAAILIFQFSTDPVRANRGTFTRTRKVFSPTVVGPSRSILNR